MLQSETNMDTDTVVVRGFSNTFPYYKKNEVMNLQFIEGEELERTWKAARRQRLKQQEERIWSEFVKEEDVLSNAVKDDPYQFLERLPEAQVKELVETEISKIKKDFEYQKRGAGDSPRNDPLAVTFDEVERDEVFHIYDDQDKGGSGDEYFNESPDSPCTVREKDSDVEDVLKETRSSGPSRPPTGTMRPNAKRSSENVATVIESSIYCAKVKDLRLKIIQELKDIIVSLENQNLAAIDSCQLRRFCRRAAEYSARYQRIHLYQMQRQVNDLKRHNAMATPYAKHTHFQSQMVRVVALHQNTLQSLEVFHKSFEQTACLRECSTQLGLICTTLRDSTAACKEVATPTDFAAASKLYNDKMLATCDLVEQAVKHYISRVDEYMEAAEQAFTPKNKKRLNKNKVKKKDWSQRGIKNSTNTTNTTTTEPNTRLSMYSLDTLRLNKKGYKSVVKSDRSRMDSTRKKGKVAKNSAKGLGKSPRARRPLMRDPHLGQDRRRNAQPSDNDIQTMVEVVEAPSSHVSTPRVRMQHRHRFPASISGSTIVPRIALQTPRAKNIPRCGKPLTAKPNQHGSNTFKHQVFPTPVSNFSSRCYRANADMEIQTMMSNCKLGNTTDRFHSPRSDVCKSSNMIDQSARSDISHTSSKGKNTSARSQDGDGNEMSRLLKQLCAGDNGGNSARQAQTSAKNAQLVCVNASSPRQPTTPQLLKILEETIQKKIPDSLYLKPKPAEVDRLRLAFNIPQNTADNLFQYRTKFVQHMLTSSMYANSTVGRPWDMVSSVSESIIDDILLKCVLDMEIRPIIQELYNSETH